MIDKHKKKNSVKRLRSRRSRASSIITDERPRLSIYRSSKHINGQIIDINGKILLAIGDTHVKDKKLKGKAMAQAAGKLLAEQALTKKVDKVVFDKGSYKYHGRVQAFAEGAREGGLIF